MKKLRTTACLFVVTAVATVTFIAPTVFGQGEKQAERGAVSGKTAGRIVRQVDHVLLVAPDNGRDLVTLLTGRFKFPVVWPQPGSEWKASTGIGLGNVTLEIFHREPSAKGEAPRVARISSLALQSTDLKAALAELRAPSEPAAPAAHHAAADVPTPLNGMARIRINALPRCS